MTPSLAGFRTWVSRGATDALFASQWPRVNFARAQAVLLTRPAAWLQAQFDALSPAQTSAGVEGVEYPRSKHTMIAWLGDRGWTMLTAKDNPFASTPTDWRNRLTGEEGRLEVLSEKRLVKDPEEKRGEILYRYEGEDHTRFTAPKGWETRTKAILEIATQSSVDAPSPPAWGRWVHPPELALGDIVVGAYGSEQRVLLVEERKGKRVLAHIASSGTFRGHRGIQRIGGRVEGQPGHAAAPNFTPAKLSGAEGPQIIEEGLAAIGLGQPQGTRIFSQGSNRETYFFLGRIGGEAASTAMPETEDPWARPLTSSEREAAQARWDALGEPAKDWPWVATVAQEATQGKDAGAISKAVGDLLRARGVDARTRMGQGTVYGSVDITFPPGQRARVEEILRPDAIDEKTASFRAFAEHGNRSDSQTDYYDPGGAQIAPDQVQAFLRYYVSAAHTFGARGKRRWSDPPTVLGRWIFQNAGDTGEARTTAPGEAPGPTAPAPGQKAGAWTSPTYGAVRVVAGAVGQRDTWHNIHANIAGKAVRYGYNGGRWARKIEPPPGLLAEVAEHGHAALFGLPESVPVDDGWEYSPGSRIQAPLSSRWHYVISHRPDEFTLSYRPPNEHHHVGTFKTLQEAKDAAAEHEAHVAPHDRDKRDAHAEETYQRVLGHLEDLGWRRRTNTAETTVEGAQTPGELNPSGSIIAWTQLDLSQNFPQIQAVTGQGMSSVRVLAAVDMALKTDTPENLAERLHKQTMSLGRSTSPGPSKESLREAQDEILTTLADQGWGLGVGGASLTIGGGRKGAVNPEGHRRVQFEFREGVARALHGGTALVTMPFSGGSPRAFAERFDAAVRALDAPVKTERAATYRDLLHFLHEGMISRYTHEVAEAFGMDKDQAYRLLRRLEARKGKLGGWDLTAEQSTSVGVGTRGERRRGEKSVGEELLWILTPTNDDLGWDAWDARMTAAGEPLLDQALPNATRRPVYSPAKSPTPSGGVRPKLTLVSGGKTSWADDQRKRIAYFAWMQEAGPAPYPSMDFPKSLEKLGATAPGELRWSVVRLPDGRYEAYMTDGAVLVPGLYTKIKTAAAKHLTWTSEQDLLRQLYELLQQRIDRGEISGRFKSWIEQGTKNIAIDPEEVADLLRPLWRAGAPTGYYPMMDMRTVMYEGRTLTAAHGQKSVAYDPLRLAAVLTALGDDAEGWVPHEEMYPALFRKDGRYAALSPIKTGSDTFGAGGEKPTSDPISMGASEEDYLHALEARLGEDPDVRARVENPHNAADTVAMTLRERVEAELLATFETLPDRSPYIARLEGLISGAGGIASNIARRLFAKFRDEKKETPVSEVHFRWSTVAAVEEVFGEDFRVSYALANAIFHEVGVLLRDTERPGYEKIPVTVHWSDGTQFSIRVDPTADFAADQYPLATDLLETLRWEAEKIEPRSGPPQIGERVERITSGRAQEGRIRAVTLEGGKRTAMGIQPYLVQVAWDSEKGSDKPARAEANVAIHPSELEFDPNRYDRSIGRVVFTQNERAEQQARLWRMEDHKGPYALADKLLHQGYQLEVRGGLPPEDGQRLIQLRQRIATEVQMYREDQDVLQRTGVPALRRWGRVWTRNPDDSLRVAFSIPDAHVVTFPKTATIYYYQLQGPSHTSAEGYRYEGRISAVVYLVVWDSGKAGVFIQQMDPRVSGNPQAYPLRDFGATFRAPVGEDESDGIPVQTLVLPKDLAPYPNEEAAYKLAVAWIQRRLPAVQEDRALWPNGDPVARVGERVHMGTPGSVSYATGEVYAARGAKSLWEGTYATTDLRVRTDKGSKGVDYGPVWLLG